MRKAVLALAVITCGVLSAPAAAQNIGPVCLKAEEFSNGWKFHFTNIGENQFLGSAQDLSANRPVSASLFITADTAVLAMFGSIPPSGTNHAFFLTANVSLATGSGPGRCEAVNNTAGCGTGIPITLGVVACPASDRTSDDALARRPTRDPGGQ